MPTLATVCGMVENGDDKKEGIGSASLHCLHQFSANALISILRNDLCMKNKSGISCKNNANSHVRVQWYPY